MAFADILKNPSSNTNYFSLYLFFFSKFDTYLNDQRCSISQNHKPYLEKES